MRIRIISIKRLLLCSLAALVHSAELTASCPLQQTDIYAGPHYAYVPGYMIQHADELDKCSEYCLVSESAQHPYLSFGWHLLVHGGLSYNQFNSQFCSSVNPKCDGRYHKSFLISSLLMLESDLNDNYATHYEKHKKWKGYPVMDNPIELITGYRYAWQANVIQERICNTLFPVFYIHESGENLLYGHRQSSTCTGGIHREKLFDALEAARSEPGVPHAFQYQIARGSETFDRVTVVGRGNELADVLKSAVNTLIVLVPGAINELGSGSGSGSGASLETYSDDGSAEGVEELLLEVDQKMDIPVNTTHAIVGVYDPSGTRPTVIHHGKAIKLGRNLYLENLRWQSEGNTPFLLEPNSVLVDYNVTWSGLGNASVAAIAGSSDFVSALQVSIMSDREQEVGNQTVSVDQSDLCHLVYPGSADNSTTYTYMKYYQSNCEQSEIDALRERLFTIDSSYLANAREVPDTAFDGTVFLDTTFSKRQFFLCDVNDPLMLDIPSYDNANQAIESCSKPKTTSSPEPTQVPDDTRQTTSTTGGAGSVVYSSATSTTTTTTTMGPLSVASRSSPVMPTITASPLWTASDVTSVTLPSDGRMLSSPVSHAPVLATVMPAVGTVVIFWVGTAVLTTAKKYLYPAKTGMVLSGLHHITTFGLFYLHNRYVERNYPVAEVESLPQPESMEMSVIVVGSPSFTY